MIGICFTKLILCPVIGSFTVIGARAAGFIPKLEDGRYDPLFTFVLLLQHATPSAINIMVVVTLHNTSVNEVAANLFWQYIFSIITLVASLTSFLYIIQM